MSVDKKLRKAKSMAKAGEFRAARQLYQSILADYPSNQRAIDGLEDVEAPVPLPLNQGPTQDEMRELMVLFDQGRYRDVLDKGKPLAGRYPGFAMLHGLIGGTYSKLEMREDALDALSRAVRLNPRDPFSRNALGSLYSKLNRSDLALENIREALKLNPRYGEAHINLGLALDNAGRRDEAIAAMSKGLELRPNDTGAHRLLSAMKKYAPDDPQIAKMQRMLTSVPSNSQEAVQLHFALGKAHDDFGETDTAFKHFQAGNRIRREALGDISERNRAQFEQVKALFEGGAIPVAKEAAPGSQRMVFIVGMPRSGTTLVEQILASHSKVHGAGELDFLQRGVLQFLEEGHAVGDTAALATLHAGYMKAIGELGIDAPVVVDKMPSNFRWTGFVLAAFPGATVIHTRRDPVAVCWSIYRHYFPAAGMDFSWDTKDLGAFHRLHDEYMAFWNETFPGQIIDLDYETLTENQESETRRLLAACGLEFEEACLKFHETERAVSTASLDQVRKPIYRGSSAAWRKYEKHLGPLIEALGDSAGILTRRRLPRRQLQTRRPLHHGRIPMRSESEVNDVCPLPVRQSGAASGKDPHEPRRPGRGQARL